MRSTIGGKKKSEEAGFSSKARATWSATGSHKEEQKEDPMMPKTLRDLDDTEASLREMATVIQGFTDNAALCNGSRHPTTVLSLRILEVMKKKAALLGAVEQRIVKMRVSKANAEALCKQLIDGPEELPDYLVGTRKFIKAQEHRPGNPIDADRSNFKIFISNMMLPAKHSALEQLRAMAEEVGDMWAKMANREALTGVEREAIERLMDTAVSAGAPTDHPYLLRTWIVLRDRIADKTLADAKRMYERDKANAEWKLSNGDVPKLGTADACADEIEASIKDAKKQGVNKKDQRLEDAMKLAHQLREEEGIRSRLHHRKTLQEAEMKRAREAQAAAKS